MFDTKFSIILPCYNLSKQTCYIDKLCDQIFKNFEIIAINDCSNDNTVQILESAKRKIEEQGIRFSIINNQINFGAGETRNIGINAAKGEYLLFLDSDDYLSDDCLKTVDEIISSKNNPDIVCFDYFVASDKIIEKHTFKNSKVVSLKDAMLYIPNGICGKCVSSQLVKKYNIKFLSIKRNEDYPFFRNAFLKANKIFYVHKCMYYYVMNSESLMHNDNLIDCDNALIAFDSISENCLDTQLLSMIFIKNCYYSNIMSMIKKGFCRKAFFERLKYLKKEYKEFYNIKYALKYPIHVFLICFMANLGFFNVLRSLDKLFN